MKNILILYLFQIPQKQTNIQLIVNCFAIGGHYRIQYLQSEGLMSTSSFITFSYLGQIIPAFSQLQSRNFSPQISVNVHIQTRPSKAACKVLFQNKFKNPYQLLQLALIIIPSIKVPGHLTPEYDLMFNATSHCQSIKKDVRRSVGQFLILFIACQQVKRTEAGRL